MEYFDEDYINLNKHNIPVSRIKEEEGKDISVYTLNYFTKMLGVTVKFDGYTFSYIPQLIDFQKEYVLQNLPKSDAYFCENSCVEIKQKYPDSIVLTENFVDNDDIYSTYRFGNFTLKPKNDKMLYLEL